MWPLVSHSHCLPTVNGADFDGSAVEVVFPESANQGDIACNTIEIVDDIALECTHNLTVVIVNATLGTMFSGSQSEATVTILDNDGRILQLIAI